MKRIITVILSLVFVSALFAQTNGRKLIAGVYSFAFEKSDTWENVEPTVISVDPNNNKYELKASFITKLLLGFSRYDYSCVISQDNDIVNVEISDISSYACDKNLKKLPKGSVYKVTSNVANDYANQMKTEIEKRLNSWSEEEYNNKLNSACTSPMILNCIAKNSALVFKKFITDNEIIGKPISFKMIVTKVDEAPNYAKGYSYYLSGNVITGYKKDSMGITTPTTAGVMVYTNNDKVISLVPTNIVDVIVDGANSDSIYEVNGTIKDISRRDSGGLSVIQINE